MAVVQLKDCQIGDVVKYISQSENPAIRCTCVYRIDSKTINNFLLINIKPCKSGHCDERKGKRWTWGGSLRMNLLSMAIAMSRVEE